MQVDDLQLSTALVEKHYSATVPSTTGVTIGFVIKTHEHLSWHIKTSGSRSISIRASIGVVLFSLLSLLVVVSLFRGVRAGSRFALAVLDGLMGFLAIGMRRLAVRFTGG